jgi:hypothetical protein
MSTPNTVTHGGRQVQMQASAKNMMDDLASGSNAQSVSQEFAADAPMEDSVEAHVDEAPEAPSNERYRYISIPITASMVEMEAGASTVKLTESQMHEIFGIRGFDPNHPTERRTNLKAVRFMKIEAKNTQSNFPMPISVQIPGITKGNTYAAVGDDMTVRSALHIGYGHDNSSRLMLQGIENIAKAFAENYPGFTAQNIGTKGVFNVGTSYLVERNHPIAHLLRANPSHEAAAALDERNVVDDKYKVPVDTFKGAFSALKQQVLDKIPDRDISSGFTVKFDRADGKGWLDYESISNRQEVLQQKFNLFLQMKVAIEPVAVSD